MKFFGKKVVSIALAALMVVSVFVTLPVSASADGGISIAANTYFYYDNSVTQWSTSGSNYLYMVLITGNNTYALSGRFSSAVAGSYANVDNTGTQRLIYRNISNDFSSVTMANVTGIAFVHSLTALTTDSGLIVNGAINESVCSDHTGIFAGALTTSSYNRCLAIPNASNTSLSFNNLGGTDANSSSVMNLTQTINITGAGSVGATYRIMGGSSNANTYSTVAESNTLNSSGSVGAVYLTTVTLTATADSANGYSFVGWYSDSSYTNVLSRSVTYSYISNGTKTIYAKFSTSAYVQTASAGEGGGTVSISGGGRSGTSITVESGTSVTFTALPNPQFKFVGWYNNAELTGDPVSTDDPYTFTASSANTLYAKFAAATYSSEEVTLSTKNTGDRHTDSTSLSAQAREYYTDEVKQYITSDKVYQTFASLSAAEVNDASSSYNACFGKGTDGINTNSLFNTLYNIMESTQNHGVVYAAYGRNSLAHYWLSTDTSAANTYDARGVYTMFYSDVDCYGHANMQREHIWPKSKASYLMKTGLGGSDLHHLRPAYGKVNNIKSNWGFADLLEESNGNWKSGWTKHKTVMWPNGGANAKISLWRAEKNGETFCDYNDDVHGDIARILLYVYTRWRQPNLYTDITTTDEDGNTVPDTSKLPELDPDDNKDTGERIIYDLSTLLQWMKEDPVSEWEMQRNDLTQQVQGNRNVFIDYPELAWLLFDQTVPSNMNTPSGMAKHQTDYSYDIAKAATVTPTNPVTLDFTIDGKGAAHITAYNNTTHMAVKNGDQVSRGDIITYSVVPDGSTLTKVTEFSSESNGTGSADRNVFLNNIDTSNAYSFTRQAGYYLGSPNTSYNKDRIKIALRSDVCVITYNINSTTTSGNTGGSGSGMVTVRRTDTGALIENGGTVPNGTEIKFTFTPDYGSRFQRISNSNSMSIPEPTRITGTDTYQTSFSVSSLNSNNDEIARTKKFTVYFAQTFNANDKVTDTSSPEYDKKQHINNKGMRPDVDDPWAEETDFTENFEICGVQIKTDEANASNKALRFVSVIDKDILSKAESYGYVIGYTNRNMNNDEVNRYAYALVKDGSTGLTVDCTGKSNDVFGDYGNANTTTNYKYLTAAVNNIQAGTNVGLNTTIIARPYVVLKPEYQATNGPSVIYGQYMDVTTGEAFCACSGSYNHVASLANAS